MDLREEVLKSVNENNFILVDNCFFGYTDSTQARREISKQLYETKRMKDLEKLTNRIYILHEAWRWESCNLINRDNVYTTAEIVEEMKAFSTVLQNAYNWHYQKIKEKVANKKINLEKDILETYPVMKYFNYLIKDVRKSTNRIKVYQGPREELPRLIEDASETDYGLVEAAMGYCRKNSEDKIAIFSTDQHIPLIIRSFLLQGNN